MSNPSTRIAERLPLHYREYYPTFILFMQKYYEWLHRESGFSQAEVSDLRADTSWIQNGIETIDQNILDLNAVRNPGTAADELADNILLEEVQAEFLTADDEWFTDASSAQVDVPRLYQESLDKWFSAFGTTPVVNDKMQKNVVDQVLMVSLLKHLYAIKGTEQSIKLFFNLFFNAEVVVYQPKFDIAVIDGGWIPDTQGHIRDDYYYNEYAYVIRTPDDPSVYSDLFNSVYLKNVHPAGFKVFLEKMVS